MAKIYYFTPNFEDFDNVANFTEEECEYHRRESNDCILYDEPSFEESFNAEYISDLGLIRIFE